MKTLISSKKTNFLLGSIFVIILLFNFTMFCRAETTEVAPGSSPHAILEYYKTVTFSLPGYFFGRRVPGPARALVKRYMSFGVRH